MTVYFVNILLGGIQYTCIKMIDKTEKLMCLLISSLGGDNRKYDCNCWKSEKKQRH